MQMWRAITIGWLVAGATGIAAGAAEVGGGRVRPFPVRGYHQHIFPDVQPMEVFHQRLEELKRYGYNLVVFGTGSTGKSSVVMHEDGGIEPVGCTADDLAKLVRHAVELGLEPVFEMKFIGKQLPIFRELVRKHPDLVIDPRNRSTILNAAFRFPDGRDAYSATALAVVDFLLGLYPGEHSARYFLLGIDEFSSDDMAELARRLHMTPAEAFAYCLNLGTDHLLKQNVTPLIWGDMLLSPALGAENHGLSLPGYQPDPRLTLQAGGAYHAVFGDGADHALHTAVNHLRDRDKIIVVDWHYQPSPTGEFPSVDYFQRVGFKDVWGAPWHDALNIRQFAKYAARRGCGGMIATAWHDAYQPESRLLLHFIIGTSAAYFRNPSIDPPPAGPTRFVLRDSAGVVVDDEKRAGCVPPGAHRFDFEAQTPEPIQATDGRLLLCAVARRGEPFETSLRFDAAARRLNAVFEFSPAGKDVQYRLQFCYTDAATGVVYLKQDSQGFVVTDRSVGPGETQDPRVLVKGDFSGVTRPDLLHGLWLDGTCSGPLGWARRRGAGDAEYAKDGGLDMQWLDRVWFLPSDYLNQAICKGMDLHVEAKMIGDFEGNSYCALFTKGSFHTGFRLLIGRDGHVLFQLARLDPKTGGPLWVRTPPGAVSKGRWFSVDAKYRPPRAGAPGSAEILIDGKRSAVRPVSAAMAPSTAVVGIGCEFRTPTSGPFGKLRPNFPGIVRRVILRTPQP